MPHQVSLPTPPHYTLEQVTLIQEEVSKLLLKQAILITEHPLERNFYSNIFLVPQKDRGQRPVINLKALYSFVHPEHFKMESIHTLKDLLGQGDWLTKVDLKDAYFAIPIHQANQKYLQFQFQGKIYHFACLPFGLSSAPWIFTQNPQASSVHSMADGCPDDHLHKWHIDHRNQALIRTLTSPSTSSRMPGVHNQYREVCTDYRPDHRVFGSHCRLHQYGAMTTAYQDEADSSVVSMDNEDGRVNLSQNPGMSSGKNELNSLRNYPCPPLLLKSTDGSFQHSEEPLTGLRRSSIPTTSQPGRTEMVGYRDAQMEWQNSSQEGDRHDHWLRCISARLGSSLWGANHRGSMVTSGGRIPHQLPRAIGSNSSCVVICEGQVQDIQTVENQQHHSSGLLKSSGSTVSEELVNLTKDLWLWCLERNIHITAQHLPGAQNFIADAESRSQTDRTDWKLNPYIFHKIQRIFGPLEVNLYETRLFA